MAKAKTSITTENRSGSAADAAAKEKADGDAAF